ncbi:ABC transporter ATP-binding protein [Spirulina sp. CS-785/01]|uniref:ABC transporter ATP-binding protein n=1 Tax=Spirulina sp. CS-785/01 TaxID=3021716 RepID=UPI00233094E1|nr:ABC transporter ATP-binding protein [Spirulina sp. CS-785/01]MDB9312937.1 ABC transporter ATP-binding protein [Spirulina sp. CS-785/01]
MLSLRHLSKSFGSRHVLEDVNFEVETGEIYGILGPNGAGKTTTINLICHLLNPDEGSIYLNAQPLTNRNKTLVGVAPQANLLYKHLTCWENLRFFAQLYGLSPQQQQQQCQYCLQAVKLSDRAHSLVSQLSGGMQRRLNLAIALLHLPKLLILDEPTSGLDIETRYDLWQLIRQLNQEGITILLSTHLLDEAEKLCDRLGILQQGKLIAEGSIEQLRDYINAQEIVTLRTPQEQNAIQRAKELGFSHRYYGGELAFWLPQPYELSEILDFFHNIPLESVSREPVKLEHIYLEITQQKTINN